jgi:hypothetical protein
LGAEGLDRINAENNPINLIDPFGLDYLVANPRTGIITHFNDDGYEGASYPYTSGRDGITDPSVPWKGPIPPGEYTLNPSEISKGSWLRDLTGDWGDYRAPLHPNDGTNTLGRDNFFLHGGDKPGSAGCIDVGSNDKNLLGPKSIISRHKGPVTVIVK